MNQLDRQVDLKKTLTQVLDGEQQIISYAGTSQYHVQDVGNPGSERTTISACGLIALNCARTVFRLHNKVNRPLPVESESERDPIDLLHSVLSEKTVKEIISISSSWPNNEHLEVNDIFDIPIFMNEFTVVASFYKQCRLYESLSQLLQETVDTGMDSNDPVAVIITRPPETVVCLIIPTSLGNFFIVYDSHPRPSHPLGSAFIINSSLEATSKYLDELLAVDPKLFSDRTIQLQSDLLAQFSGHILVPKKNTPSDSHDKILMAASMTILQFKAQDRELTKALRESKYDEPGRIPGIDLNRDEASLDHKGKQKATNDGLRAPFQGNRWSKKANKSPSLKAGQSSNHCWEDTYRNRATGGKRSYRPQGWHNYDDEPSANQPSASRYGMLNPFALGSAGNHNDLTRTPGIKLNHDNQDRELVKLQRELKHNEPGTPGMGLNHDIQDREPASALRESKYDEPGRIPWMDLNCDAQDREPAIRKSKFAYNSDVIRTPNYSALNRQMHLDDPSPSPTHPVQVQVDVSDVASSNLAMELQRLYDEEDRQLSALDRQMDLGDPSPFPTSPVQVQVDASDVASSNLAIELQRLYDEEDRQLSTLDRQMDLGDPSPFPTHPVQVQMDVSDVASLNLAMKLQSLYDKEARRRRPGAKRSALKRRAQVEFFDCGICFENLHRENIVQFANCKHRYCRSCLREHVGSTLEQRRYPIICPECKAEKVPNPSEVEDVMFNSLGPSSKDLQVFYELQLAAHSVTLHCRRCQQTMNVDREEYRTTTIITCPLPGCSYTWCKECQQPIVLGGPEHSCDGVSELQHLMEKNGWRRCPGCEIPIQKSEGCRNMTCSSPGCNTQFCYACGEKAPCKCSCVLQ